METKGLKVLMISSDRKILVPESAVSVRMKEYGAMVSELHIVLFSDSAHNLKETQLDKNVWVYPTNSFNRWFRPFAAARMGKKIIYDKKFVRGQAVITSGDPFECGWAALKIKKKWRLPLEIQLHTDPFTQTFGGFLNSIRKSVARKVMKNADRLRVVSESLKTSISSQFSIDSNSISVLPILVDKKKIEEWKITFDLHARFGWHFVILSVARLESEKNLSLALEVLRQVRAKYQDTGLVIVGSGSEESKLKSLVKKLDLEKHVVFAGWQEDVGSYYKTANAFLQTSKYEGYGMALVEAGLAGVPVVTTPVGIALELQHGKDAYIYPIGNPELFAAGIIELIENNAKRENLRANLKSTLESKLLSKEDYLKAMLGNWQEVSKMVRV